MKPFTKFLSLKSLVSGIVLIILGAYFFIATQNKVLAYILFLGGLLHEIVAIVMYIKKQKQHKAG